MFKLYYASAIDTCVDKAFKQIDTFKKIFKEYSIEVCGAGFGESPIIDLETSSKVYRGVLTAYDLRILRGCDILLLVTDLKQFAAGTMMELEYARQLGIYIIIMYIPSCSCGACKEKRVKNIFLETYANKIIYSLQELGQILKELSK